MNNASDATPDIILPGGQVVAGKTITQQLREVEMQANPAVRIRAHALEYPHKHCHVPVPVRVAMPSGAVIVVGGEALVQALSNGGQPYYPEPEIPTLPGIGRL
jgi:hypothetical protein